MRPFLEPAPTTIRAARGGDPRALGIFFDATWTRAWQLAYGICGDRALAEDAAQEGLLKAIRSLDHFDESRPLAPWLHKIIARTTIDAMRRESKYARGQPTPPSEPAGDYDEVWTWLDVLSPERRAIIVLRFWLEYEPSEIAEILAVPAGTVYSRLHRALDDIRPLAEVTRGKQS